MLSQITCNSLDCADKSRRSDHPGDVLQEMKVVSDDQSAPEREKEGISLPWKLSYYIYN